MKYDALDTIFMILPPSEKRCPRGHFTKTPFTFLRQAPQSVAPAPSPRHAPTSPAIRHACSVAFYENPLHFPPTSPAIRRACSVASPRADKPRNPSRLLRRLATRRPAAPSPGHVPAAFSLSSRRFSSSAPGDQEGRDPLSCKARYLPAPAAALMSWSSYSRPRAPRPRVAAEVNGCCSSSRSSSSSPSSLHQRRRRRFCFCCPLAHGNAAIGGLGAEEWMLLPLIKEFCV